jgi:CRISPR-associated exonuclease Cas4
MKANMTINIRSIQHYMYCPRRFGLLEIDNDWRENAYVVKADILHENVHSGRHSFKGKSKVELSSITLYNDLPGIDIYGIADCVEFEKSDTGVFIKSLNGYYTVKVIEYKPRKPRNGQFNETDAIQVFAQKLCADYIWKCSSRVYIYYSDVKRRVELPFEREFDKYYALLMRLLEEMRGILNKHEIPQKRKGQVCKGCSLLDICLPKVIKSSTKKSILSMLNEDD